MPSTVPFDAASAFTVAEGRHAGLTGGRLRSAAWRSPHHGMRAGAEASLRNTLAALMRALPPHAFACGPTAAALHGLPLPLRLHERAWHRPSIGVATEHTRIRRPDVVGRRLAAEPDDIVDVDGIRCLSPTRVWAELAETLSVGHLTAVSDRLLARSAPMATRDDLERMHRRFLGGRGSPTRRLAVDFASDRS